MSKSIMHDKRDGTCYLCMLLNGDFDRRTYLEEHHVMNGTRNKKHSEHYGLKVYLCVPHHREGDEAVHKKAETMRLLQRKAQEAFERKYPNLSFRDIFGKNCLDDEEGAGQKDSAARQQPSGAGFQASGQAGAPQEDGIQFITDGVDGMDWE